MDRTEGMTATVNRSGDSSPMFMLGVFAIEDDDKIAEASALILRPSHETGTRGCTSEDRRRSPHGTRPSWHVPLYRFSVAARVLMQRPLEDVSVSAAPEALSLHSVHGPDLTLAAR